MKMWLKHKLLPALTATAGLFLLKLLMCTCRVRINGAERFTAFAKENPTVVLLWHNRLPLVVWTLEKAANTLNYAAVVSRSRDGMLLTKIAEKYKPQGKVITVSHRARHNAMREMVEELKRGDSVLLVTPDGPRGPRYKMKPGAPRAAKIAGAGIVPFSWTADRYWKLRTWDGMRFPKPFSSVEITFGDPSFLHTDDEVSEAERLLGNLS